MTPESTEPSPLALRIQKYFIWGTLIGIIYLLRDLFPVIFLTFILTYIANSCVRVAEQKLRIRLHRRVILTFIYTIIILVMIGIVYAVLPRIYDEARQLARSYIAPPTATRAETVPTAPDTAAAFRSPSTDTAAAADTGVEALIGEEVVEIFDSFGGRILGAESYGEFRESAAFRNVISEIEDYLVATLPQLARKIGSLANYFFILLLHFMLALLFSYLIVWDLPRISASVAEFSTGRSAAIYDEIAPGMRAFGVMLGRAFEAQTGIAIVNSVLTSIGFLALGIPSIALLAMIVFFCSYIPVLGVVLSTMPAGLLALKIGGVELVLAVIVMVLVVHAIEAYGLNPLIYGHHMRMHPVAVLVVLMVGEHLFGIWGLLLGVPVTAFFLKYVVKGEKIE